MADKELAITVSKSSKGGPRGSDPETNPWLVRYKKGGGDWQALGRWPTRKQANTHAARFARAGQARGFKVHKGYAE